MNIVIFTGAGISADSGIDTFRDKGGLWEKFRIEEVCTPEALLNNRNQVIEFYNQRRKELLSKEPNLAHYAISELEKYFSVQVITQNVDDLHERAGSKNIIHLHGELRKLCSTKNHRFVYPIEGWKQDTEERSKDDNSLLRPYIVFFGEPVPMFERATEICKQADLFIIIGTSLAVYPAASLIHYIKTGIPVFIVDPNKPDFRNQPDNLEFIQKNAVKGVPSLCKRIIEKYKS